MAKIIQKIKEIDRKTDYKRLFYIASIAIHALGLIWLLVTFTAYTSLTSLAETWPKLAIVPTYIFVAVFGADGLSTEKIQRFVWATITNFIILFTF